MLRVPKLRNQTSALLSCCSRIHLPIGSHHRIVPHRITLTEISHRILFQYSHTEWQKERAVGRCIVKEKEPELNGYNSRQGLDWRGTSGNAIPSCLSFPPFYAALPSSLSLISLPFSSFTFSFLKLSSVLSSILFTSSKLSPHSLLISPLFLSFLSYLLLSSLSPLTSISPLIAFFPLFASPQILATAVKRYPAGAANRWTSVTHYVNDKVVQCSAVSYSPCSSSYSSPPLFSSSITITSHHTISHYCHLVTLFQYLLLWSPRLLLFRVMWTA